ncbi:MAG: hypothetical protein RLZZ221_1180 [Verrucomicrobiota bacterium]|jgi:hypothetical protein
MASGEKDSLFPRALSARLALLLSGLLLGGCATTHELKIDSIAKPRAADAISYEIRNKNPLVADDSLRFKEAAGFVKTALSGRGMYEAPPNTKADMIVDVDYGVSPPKIKQEMVSEPVYVTVPGQVRMERIQVGTDSQGRPVYQTVTVQDPPTTQFAGFREYMVTVTVYEKYLKMSARENKEATEGRPVQEIWTVDVTSEGESRDVRKHLPILVAASIDYVGKDSQGQKTIRLKDNSSDIAFVKKGM